jgi:hypothetical protein
MARSEKEIQQAAKILAWKNINYIFSAIWPWSFSI